MYFTLFTYMSFLYYLVKSIVLNSAESRPDIKEKKCYLNLICGYIARLKLKIFVVRNIRFSMHGFPIQNYI